MKTYQVLRATQLIKDYKFKNFIFLQLEMFMLTLISSVSCSVTVIPYSVVLVILCLVLVLSNNQKKFKNTSNFLNLPILALLLVDLPAKYIMRSTDLLNDTDYQIYLRDLIGFLYTLPSFLDFYIKIAFFIVECQKLQYSYNYSIVFEQIRNFHKDKPQLKRIFKKKESFSYRLVKPISLFMFCSLSFLFILLHPSVFLLVCMPLIMVGFFRQQMQFKNVAKFFAALVIMYVLTEYIYNIVILARPSSQKLLDATQLINKIFGFYTSKNIFNKIFPCGADFLLILLISSFTMYIAKQKFMKDHMEQKQAFLKNKGHDDLISESEFSSKHSIQLKFRKTKTLNIRTSGRQAFTETDRSFDPNSTRHKQFKENPPVIKEDQKEDDEQDDLTMQDVPLQNEAHDSGKRQQLSLQSKQKSAWTLSRDETTRGNIRRFIFKVYLKVNILFQRFLNLIIIYSTKFSLLALFFVSVYYPTFFNLVLFVLFLILALTSYQQQSKYWKFPAVFNSIILLCMYSYDVFSPNGIEGIHKSYLVIIGITIDSDINYMIKYLPYLFLLLVLVLNSYVIKSERYERILISYYVKENMRFSEERKSEESEQFSNSKANDELISESPDKLYSDYRQEDLQSLKEGIIDEEEKVIVSDPITKLIIKYAVFLLIIALFLECSLVPVNLINLILLILIAIIVGKYFYNDTSLTLYKNLRNTLFVTKYSALIFIFLKYLFQFEIYKSDYEQSKAYQFYRNLPYIQQIMGIEHTKTPLKLLCLAAVLVLSNTMLKCLEYRYLTEILREDDKEWNRLQFLDSTKKTKLRLFFHSINIYLHFIIYYISFLLPQIIIIAMVLNNISILGGIFLFFTIILLYTQRATFWEKSYQQLGLLSSITIIVLYIGQLIYTNIPEVNDALKQIGIKVQVPKGQAFENQLFPYFIVLIACFIQKLSQKSKSLFSSENIKQYLVQEKQEDLSQQEVNSVSSLEDQENDSNQNKSMSRSLSQESFNKDYNKITKKKSPKMGVEIEKEALEIYERPILHCLFLRDTIMRVFIFSQGLNILALMGLITMFYKLNITSLILSIVFLLILTTNYYPIAFKETPQIQEKRQLVSRLIKLQIGIISFIILEEYILSFANLYLQRWMTWKNEVTSKLCFTNSQDCTNEWEQWLSLSNFSLSYIIFDFVYLITCYINLFFTTQQIQLQENQIKEQPIVNDKNDFISQKPTHYTIQKFKFIIYYIIFNGYSYFFIAYLFILASTFHGTGTSDLISAIYMLFAFYFILNLRKFYTKNSQILNKICVYNYIVFFALIIFQIPVFICPISNSTPTEDTFVYLKRETCVNLMEDRAYGVTDFGKNYWFSLYIVFTQSLGLYKIFDQLQMVFILMIIFTEIQNHIFYHPYFQEYVLKHMETERETDGQLRAFMFVERTHLRRSWAYKAIKEEIKILRSKLVRINNDIKSIHMMKEESEQESGEEDHKSEDFLGDQNKFGIESETNSLIADDKHKANPLEGKVSEKRYEKYLVRIEDLALELLEQSDQPVITLKKFKERFIEQVNLMDSTQISKMKKDEDFLEQELFKITLKLQKEVHLKNRTDLYNKESIGLNFAIQNGSLPFLHASDYLFYFHLIYEKLPENYSMLEQQKYVSSLQQNYDDINSTQQLTYKKQMEFEIREPYETYQTIIREQKKNSKKGISNEVIFWLKVFLWTKLIDQLLFYSLTKGKQKKNYEFNRIPFFKLLASAIFSQSGNICYIILFINFIINGDLISLMLPLSVLIYAMIDNPIPNKLYWSFLMYYMFIILALKFTYQLPIFCSTPAYNLSVESCSNSQIPREVLVSRIDYIIGIHKFAGPASYPVNQGIFRGILPDLIVLFALVLHKNYLYAVGVWHYVKVKSNIYVNPTFRCKVSQMTRNEQLDLIKTENYQIYNYENANYFMKKWMKIQEFFKWLSKLRYKLLPVYMDKCQKNLDLRKQDQSQFINHEFIKVKPGKNYFPETFFTLLIILIYNLFFYRSIIGESSDVGLSSVNLQRFASAQVFVLFFILSLLMTERMLYRTRLNLSKASKVEVGFLTKHSLTVKMCIHIFLVITVHIVHGFVIPKKNKLFMDNRFALVLSYIMWILYFIFSSLQIRNGFPQVPFKPPFAKDTSLGTQIAFRVYKAIPFLWEMKVIIDWTVTKTSLDLFQWFKIDDAFNYLYYNRIQNDGRLNFDEYAAQPWSEKFLKGFCFAFGLILIILAPILLFSGLNPIMVKNPVKYGSLSLSLEMNSNGNSYSILQTQAINISPINLGEVDDILTHFTPANIQLDAQEMQKMSFSPYSDIQWIISPPSLSKFISDYYYYQMIPNSYVEIQSKWDLVRENPVGAEEAQGSNSMRLPIRFLQPIIDLIINDHNNTSIPQSILNISSNSSDDNGQELVEMSRLQNSSTIEVQNIFPKILQLGSTPLSHNLNIYQNSNLSYMTSVNLTINRDDRGDFYWTFDISDQDQQGVFKSDINSNIVHEDGSVDGDLVMIVYNEEVIGAFFGNSQNLSVVGLYATIVIAVGGFIRLIFDRTSQRVIYEEIPNPDKLYEICEGIFIAQLDGDLMKEKKLYNLLIKIYRSPETMIKITGTKLKYKKSKKKKD